MPLPNNVRSIPWSESVWFLDIDDTLVNTNEVSDTAAEAIGELVQEICSLAEAQQVKSEFNQIFHLMMAGYRVQNDDWTSVAGGQQAFKVLWQQVEQAQQPVKEQFGSIQKWSREVYTKLAADRVGVEVTPELIRRAGQAYWDRLAELVIVYPHAWQLITTIKQHDRPIIFMTSSDARLTMREDGLFEYDPDYSRNLKHQRINKFKAKGLLFDALNTGDPEDKPSFPFFDKGIREAEKIIGKPLDPSHALMVGDSYPGDLKIPKEKGFDLVVLFDEQTDSLQVVDSHYIITNDISQINQFLTE